jgi:hypothetical protein
MPDYRMETRVSSDGSLILSGLPFQAGEKVEVIVQSREHWAEERKCYPMRGKPVRFIDPFGSVAEEDWEALK